MKLSRELLKLVIDNPELEIKFNISGELNKDNNWFIGEITYVKIGDYIEYNNGNQYDNTIFDEEEDVIETLYDDISHPNNFTDDEYENIVQEEYNKLPKKKVIWVYVGSE